MKVGTAKMQSQWDWLLNATLVLTQPPPALGTNGTFLDWNGRKTDKDCLLIAQIEAAMGSGMALGDYNCSTGLNESLHGNKLVIVSL